MNKNVTENSAINESFVGDDAGGGIIAAKLQPMNKQIAVSRPEP